jgi:alpha-D-ribose 1-methylphosphonate 5-triphosphate diphosphatase
MDHTPGQRQWRDLASHKRYTMSATGMSEAEFDTHVTKRIAEGGANARRNRPIVIDMLRSRGIPLATHDDTTEEHVRSAVVVGIAISEFPTILVAAETAKALGLATVAGAPNVVCGGSHSGGVSVGELAERGVLDGLSSDYVPASLLQAAQQLSRQHGIAFPTAMGMVTWRIADMLGLTDRGRLCVQTSSSSVCSVTRLSCAGFAALAGASLSFRKFDAASVLAGSSLNNGRPASAPD